MSRFAILMCLVPIFSVRVFSQSFPRAEVSVGYSYIRFHPGSAPPASCNGGYGAMAANFKPWLGASGNVDICRIASGATATEYLLGPHFAYRKCCRVTPYAHALFGGTHVSSGFPSVTGAANTFSFSAGGGLDIAINCRLAIRVGEADYLLTRFNGAHQNNFQFRAGIVLRRW